jgi:serine/threonine protein kinase
VRVGDYLILSVLGAGGMGTVFLADEVRAGRKVAIKAMRPDLAADPASRERFLREARAAAAVDHDNVVRVLYVGEAPDGTPYIVMPVLKGEPLDSYLKREHVAPTELVLKVARDVAAGLAAAHAAGLIHRDIKPANIWLETDPAAPGPVRRCQVLVFGLARPLAAPGDIELTSPNAILGTPAYMPPEQARGEVLDARADLYSLGATLYRMATGALPFTGANALAVMTALLSDTAAPSGARAPHLPPALAALIDRLMAKDRDARPASAAEVLAELDRVAAGAVPRVPYLVEVTNLPHLPTNDLSASAAQLVPAPLADQTTAPDAPEPLSLPPAPPPKRRAALVAALAAVLALVAFGVWQLAKPRGDAPSPDVAKKDEPPATDHDRAAAKYALSVGGTVRVNGAEVDVFDEKDLPPGPFRLTFVAFNDDKRITDGGLAVFRDCKHLAELQVYGAKLSDAALAHFAGAPELDSVTLHNTNASAKAIAKFAACPKLKLLSVTQSGLDDDAHARFKNCPHLRTLCVAQTPTTLAGITALRDLPLEYLDVSLTLTETKQHEAIVKAFPKSRIAWNGGGYSPPGPPPGTPPDSDRAAAVWVIATGGSVRVNEDASHTANMFALPDGPFRLTGFTLWHKPQVADDDFKVFSGCRNLAFIDLFGSPIGDAGLAHLPANTFLTRLHLADLPNLTDGGLRVFKDCRNLATLNLTGCPVTANVLEHFTGCANLGIVALARTRVTDKGLERFKDFPKLVSLSLRSTDVTDAGMLQLIPCKGLTFLNVEETKVAEHTVALFAKAHPECRVFWNGGFIPAATEADRTAAERVQAAGGTVLTYGGVEFGPKDPLPKDPFRLTGAFLTGPRTDDDTLAPFAKCQCLQAVSLSGTNVTAAGLAHLAGNKNLATLNLSGTKVDDGAAAVLVQFPKLVDLAISETQMTEKGAKDIARALPACRVVWTGGTIEPFAADRRAAEWVLASGGRVHLDGAEKGLTAKELPALPKQPFRLTGFDLRSTKKADPASLAVFADCANLTYIGLSQTNVTDAGLKHFARSTNLAILDVSLTAVSATGLEVFKDVTTLTDVFFHSTQITNATVAHLAASPGLKSAFLKGTPITDAGLAHLKRCKGLTFLDLKGTKVSLGGIADFAQAVPKCKIEWDKDVPAPKKQP